MKKGFSLVEMLIVVTVLVTLMAITFRLGAIGGTSSYRNTTVSRLQRLENCLSGYYAAFGSYPPVPLQGRSRSIYTRVDENGVLDYDSLTVTKGTDVQELPQKEFLLLFKLLSYPGKIFTRIQLMDEIWGADSDTGWETVTVHIGRLRKRFDNWDEFSIESVRGLGYKAVKKI